MNNCILCLNKTLKKNSVDITEEDECGSSVEQVLMQHFWFYDKILDYSRNQSQSVVCKTCWNKLEDFNEFFTAVKYNHKADDEEKPPELWSKEGITEDPEKDFEIEEKDPIGGQSMTFDDEDYEMSLCNDEESLKNDENLTYTEEVLVEELESLPDEANLSILDESTAQIHEETSSTTDDSKDKKIHEFTAEELTILLRHTTLNCELCAEHFVSWKSINSHYREAHKTKYGWIRCCGRKIDRFTEIRDHIAWHENSNLFQCLVCGKSLINRDNLKIHAKVHVPNAERLFSCDLCSLRFTDTYKLTSHMRKHEKEGLKPTIPCKHCQKLFKTPSQLKTHVNYCHKPVNPEFVCYICKKVLKTRRTLENHVTAHTNPESPRECQQCGHILKNTARFNIHMAKHRSEELGPHPCDKNCGKIFKNRSAMLAHVAFVHTTKSFKCSECVKVFKNKKSLEEHEAVHKNINIYSCPFCDRKMKNSANMYAHKKKAHPEEFKMLPKPSYLGLNVP